MRGRYVLVHSGGQNPDGTMTAQTERNCQRAVEFYFRENDVAAIILTTSERTRRGKKLIDEMRRFLASRNVRDIIELPTAKSRREASDQAAEYLENIDLEPCEHLIHVGF